MVRLLKMSFSAFVLTAMVSIWSQPALAQFETRSNRSVNNVEYWIAAGDFNRDGKMDVALEGDQLYVLLGNGDGTFQKPLSNPIIADSMAVADFNGDGIPDVVISNFEESSVSVLLGNGDGTFRPAIASPTTAASNFMAVGDFNNDGKPDIVVIDYPYASVLLGNGDGTFQAPSDITYIGAHELAVGDFNNDKKLDVAAVGYNFGASQYGILLGNGDGTLQSPITHTLIDTPGAVATADFNRDGNLDLAIGGYIGGGVVVLLGLGDGTFQPPVTYPSNTGGPIVIADFNHDGILDMVIGSGLAAGVQEFLGAGDGTFSPPVQYDSGTAGAPIASDFNNDALPDLALIGIESGVTTMLNTGSLIFTPSSPLLFSAQLVGTTSPPQSLAVTNAGAKAISLSPPTRVGDFQIINGCGSAVGPGATCSLTITFAPKAIGARRGMIAMRDSELPQALRVLLSGQSVPLDVSPAQMNFPRQKVGTTSPPQTVTVLNASTVSVPLTPVEVGGSDNNDFHQTNNCGTQIAPRATCQIFVRFTPHKSGNRSGNVDFTVSEPSSFYKVILRGTGV